MPDPFLATVPADRSNRRSPRRALAGDARSAWGRATSLALVVALCAALTAGRVAAQTLQDELWVTDGTVHAVLATGGVVYLGGDFGQVGPATGSFLKLDATTGAAVAPFARVTAGTVRAIVPDGNGGWFIGGNFASVRGIPRNNLAQIDATGALTDWDPGASMNPNSTVFAMLRNGPDVLVGGFFANVGGAARNNIASIDAATGQANAWNPNANNSVFALAFSGSTIYAAGAFTTMGGLPRNALAGIDNLSGSVTGWNPNATPVSVTAMVVSGGTMYVGGTFTNVGGQPRNRIAALNLVTGSATGWNPNATAGPGPTTVFTIAVNGSTVYAGGSFGNIGGQARNNIAALDATTGNATSWNANANNLVLSLALNASKVYAGGFFQTIGGQTRNSLAALDASTGAATSWNPKPNSSVFSLAVDGNSVVAGGWMTSAGGLARSRLAAFDLSTGAATAWNPGADLPVRCFVRNGSSIYVGGEFGVLAGQPRSRLGAFDVATGNLTSWDPGADGGVFALAQNGGTVYAGGDFASVRGQSHVNLAAIDAATGLPKNWNASASSPVSALAVHAGKLYVGGMFFQLAGSSRNYLGAVLESNGSLTAWNPDPDGQVTALAVRDTMVFAGGWFANIGGRGRSFLAALDTSSGAARADWVANTNGGLAALALSGGKLYAAGEFGVINGLPRSCVAQLIASTGSVTPWNANPDFHVEALSVDSGILYMGGSFHNAIETPHSNIAGLSEAVLRFTPDDLGRGLVVTDFIVGFSPGPGPAGIGFLPNHGVFVTHPGKRRLYSFPSHDDNQKPELPLRDYTPAMPGGFAQLEIGGTWHYYMTLGNELVEVDPGTGATQTVASITGAQGIVPFPPAVASPFQGHVFVASFSGIWDVNPVTQAVAPFSSDMCVGLAFSPAGDRLYAALVGTDAVRAYSFPGATPVWDSPGHGDGYSGVALGLGTLDGYVYASTMNGKLWEFGVPGGPHSGIDNLLATGAAPIGGMLAVDPDVTSGGFPSLLMADFDRIARIDPPGGGWFGAPTSSAVPVGGTSGVPGGPRAAISLSRPSPNPAVGSASFVYALPAGADLELAVYGVDGRRVRTLEHGRVAAGVHSVTWDGRDDRGNLVRSGVFFVKLDAAGQRRTRSMVLLR